MNRSAKKERLRGVFLERRREMSFEEVYRLSSRVQKRFLSTGYFKKAGTISLYSSFQNEVLTDEVFSEAIGAGKEVYYPRVVKGSRRLKFFRITGLDELSPGSYEIPEPAEKEETSEPSVFDLVVVPGVAFDLKGGRIGFGKGYYDMALEKVSCRVVAFAYEFQVINEIIPVEPHDVRVEAIITEKRVIDVRG